MKKNLAYKTLVDSIVNKAAPFIGAYLTNCGLYGCKDSSPYLALVEHALYLVEDEKLCGRVLALIERVASEANDDTGFCAAFGVWLIHLPAAILDAKLAHENELELPKLVTTIDIFDHAYMQTI